MEERKHLGIAIQAHWEFRTLVVAHVPHVKNYGSKNFGIRLVMPDEWRYNHYHSCSQINYSMDFAI